ncbi:RICIN domain-containing protein [Ruegeria jejuensis]|uniref:RICIN domain-containing protein n=1 Tax=Ruegeria jejuensis TaxID=3233338 RepID=UPI00355AD238
MFPQRVNELSVRAGGNTTRFGEFDGMGALAPGESILGDTVYVFYRGYDKKETIGGKYQLSLMTAPRSEYAKPGINGDWRVTPLIPPPSDYALIEPAFSAAADDQWRDLLSIVVDGTIYIYSMVVGATQRMVRFSFDEVGEIMTYDGECLWNGGSWGANIGAVYHHNNNWFVACGVNADDAALGQAKRMRRSATGVGDTWTGQNDIMQPTGADGDIDRYSYVTGWGWQDASYAYMMVPSIGHVDHIDWPEGITLFRTPLSILDQTDNTWEKYPYPIMLRDPNESATWQLSYADMGDGFRGSYLHWGIDNLEAVGATEMLDDRDIPYNGNDADFFPTSYKNVINVKWGSRLALEDWNAPPVVPDRYRIQNVKTGQYMVATDVTENALCQGQALSGTDRDFWDISYENGFSILTNAASGKILRVRDNGRGNNKFCAVFDSPGTGSANYSGQWLINPVHDIRSKDGTFIAGGRMVQITNRYSSLRLKINETGDQITQRKDAHGTDGWWRLLKAV